MDKAKIRPIESFPVEQNGQKLVCLRDPLGIATQPIVLGMGAYFLVTQFNGTTSLAGDGGAFTQRFGEDLPPDQLANLVAALDQAGFLDSPAFGERRPAGVRGIPPESAPSGGACRSLLCQRSDAIAARDRGFFPRAQWTWPYSRAEE